jgi:hypothetical protein
VQISFRGSIVGSATSGFDFRLGYCTGIFLVLCIYARIVRKLSKVAVFKSATEIGNPM